MVYVKTTILDAIECIEYTMTEEGEDYKEARHDD